MKKNQIKIMYGAIIFIALLLVWGIMRLIGGGTSVANAKVATIYKSPTCGCCGIYATYLKNQGYNVKIINLNDLSSIKSKYNISSDKLSCHTTVIDDYAFEGHIPVEAINKFLSEKPNLKGLTLPAMPIGSPGMPGVKRSDFIIYGLDGNTADKVYMTI